MLDTPKRGQEREAIGELGFLVSEIEQEPIPASLVSLAERLGDAIAADVALDIETA